MKCKSFASPSDFGQNLGRLESLIPVQRADGFALQAIFALTGGKSVIAFVKPEKFRGFAKALTEKGAITKSQPIDGTKLIGCMASLEIGAGETKVKRLKSNKTPEDKRQKEKSLAEVRELTRAQ
jgi:hypothetical protein